MPSFNAGNIEATASVDRTQFVRDLQEMRADANREASRPIEMRATLDTTAARAKLDELKADLASTRNTINIRATLDDGGLKAQLASLKTQLGAATGSTSIRLQVEVAGSAAALSSLSAIDAAVNRLDGKNIEIRVGVADAAARASLERLRLDAERLGRLRPTINPNVNPRGQQQVSDLQRSFNDVKKAMPGLVQAVLPLLPALAPIGVAAAGASVGLLSMVAAGGGVAALFGGVLMTAVKGATADAKAYTTAQQGVVKAEAAVAGTKAGTQARTTALKNLATAQKALTAATQNYTPAERSFNSAMEGVKTSWQNLVHATSADTLGPASTVLKAVAANVGKLKPVLDAVRPVVQAVADAFARWMGGGGLTTFVNFLVTRGVPILNQFQGGIRSLLGVLGMGMTTFGKFGSSIAVGFNHITQSMLSWAQGSNGGPGGFQNFLSLVQRVGPMVVSFLQQFATTTGHLGQTMAILGPLSLSVGTYLLRLINAIPIPVLTVIVGLFLAYKDAILAYRVAILAANIAGVLFRAGMIALSATMAVTPIGWLIIGITALVAAIVLIATKTTWFQTAWKYTWNAIKQVASDIWGFLTGKWGYLIAVIGPVGWFVAIGTHWSQVWGAIKAVASSVWGWMQTAWRYTTNFISGVFDGFMNALKTAWNASWTWIKNTTSSILNGIQGVVKSITDTIQKIWHTALNGVSSVASGIWNGIMTSVHTFQSGFKAVFTDITNATTTVWNGLKAIFAKPINFVIDTVWNHGIAPLWSAAHKIVPVIPAPPTVSKIPGYAKGTSGAAPGWAWVGEKGPELMHMHGGETVVPAHQSPAVAKQLGSGIGGYAGGTLLEGSVPGVPVGPGGAGGRDPAQGAPKGLGKTPLDALKQAASLPGVVVSAVKKMVLGGMRVAFDAGVNPILKAATGSINKLDGNSSAVTSLAMALPNLAKNAVDNILGQNDAQNSIAGGFQSYASAGPKVQYGGVTLDTITLNALKKAFGFAGFNFGLTQGSFNNSVGASAGTHAGGGALDANIGGFGDDKIVKVVRGLRQAGFAAWHRTESEGFSPHVHAILGGDPLLSPEAAAQLPDYLAHKTGLVGHAQDTDPDDVKAGWPGLSGGGANVSGAGVGDMRAWSRALLTGLGDPLSASNLKFVYDWTLSEGGPITNPLNVAMFSSSSKQPSWTVAQGLNKTIQTIQQSNFAGIAGALRGGDGAGAKAALIASPWAASHYYGGARFSNASYANGTDGAARGWALVGEQGPEMMYMHGGETVIPNHLTKQVISGAGASSGMRGYAGGTLAAEIAGKLKSATSTTASRQRSVNSLQDLYDQQRLNAAYAKTAKQRAADAAEEKVTAAKLSAAKHQLTQAKQSEAQLKSDYAAATKASSAAAAAIATAAKATGSTFTTWLNAQKSVLATQVSAATDIRNSYLSSAQGSAPALAGLNSFTAIAGAFNGATANLNKVGVNVTKLKARGVSGGIINSILAMSPADALNYSNTLVNTDGAGIAAADAAYASFSSAADAYATTGANASSNYSGLLAAQKSLGTVTIKQETPTKLQVLLPDGTTVTGTLKSLETKIETQVLKIVNNAKNSKKG